MSTTPLAEGQQEQQEEEQQALPPSPSIVTCMKRGWQRACPLLGAMMVAALVVVLLEFLALVAAGRIEWLLEDALATPAPLQILSTTLLIVILLLVLAYTVAGCICVRPAVVWGRRAVLPAVRQSFELAQGHQWYILCLLLSVALVETLWIVTLWTILGDFGSMALVGVEFTPIFVLALGGMAMLWFVLLCPAVSLVLETVLYIHLRACQGTYTRQDLLDDLQIIMSNPPQAPPPPQQRDQTGVDASNNNDALTQPLLANSLSLNDDNDNNNGGGGSEEVGVSANDNNNENNDETPTSTMV